MVPEMSKVEKRGTFRPELGKSIVKYIDEQIKAAQQLCPKRFELIGLAVDRHTAHLVVRYNEEYEIQRIALLGGEKRSLYKARIKEDPDTGIRQIEVDWGGKEHVRRYSGTGRIIFGRLIDEKENAGWAYFLGDRDQNDFPEVQSTDPREVITGHLNSQQQEILLAKLKAGFEEK